MNPRFTLNINSEVLNDENVKELLLKAHTSASQQGMLYFANLSAKDNQNAVFSSSGTKLTPDLSGDWETDTLQTGCLGYVTINLPRIVQEAEGDKNKFFTLLKERYELSARALGIKYNTVKNYV